jgi:hypothetical protein
MPVIRNYKTKEKNVIDFIKQTFSEYSWVSDKRVIDGCSSKRPDIYVDMGSHIIVIEVDENQHKQYDCSCENKRLMEISQDFNFRPIVLIRFNPDGYIKNNGIKVTSCWISGQTGIYRIPKNKHEEWQSRLNILKEHIEYWAQNETNKTIELIHLFFDNFE